MILDTLKAIFNISFQAPLTIPEFEEELNNTPPNDKCNSITRNRGNIHSNKPLDRKYLDEQSKIFAEKFY